VHATVSLSSLAISNVHQTCVESCLGREIDASPIVSLLGAMTPPPSDSCVISIVMPVYNGESTVSAAIQSILNQDFADFEILVVNDGSTDGSARKIEEFAHDPRLKVLEHPEGANRGASASRLLALLQARGEFIAFLDADDEFLPGKLSRHVAILRRHPEVLLVHGRVTRRTDDPSMAGWTLNLGEEQRIYDMTREKYFLRRNYICNSTVVCRRSALLLQEDAPPVMIGQAEDWVLWICVACRGLLCYDPEPLTFYAYHEGAFTHRMLRKPGAVELTAIEFYLCILPRLPRLSMRLRALFALLYNLTALAEIRRGPVLKRGLAARCLNWIFNQVRKKTS